MGFCMGALGLIDRLAKEQSLSVAEYEVLLRSRTAELEERAAELACAARTESYGVDVYIRGLIEISNHCINDCFYCGIRKSNRVCDRYRLATEQVLSCCEAGYCQGIRTFVLQGGEDPFYTDKILSELVGLIKSCFSDCAVTFSLGERSPRSYLALHEAGADRYLLRHETIDSEHYGRLHPSTMSHERRLNCLFELRKAGFQTGCGFMVGSPFQTNAILARELKFMEEFKPEMCGIGPFIPHGRTPFAAERQGSAGLTCYLISLIRLINPDVLLPATTALEAVGAQGRERGLRAGANVLMPNLTPAEARARYDLYGGKTDAAIESCLEVLESFVAAVGCRIAVGRGDYGRARK